MEKNRHISNDKNDFIFHEIILASSDNVANKQVAKLLRSGKIRKIAPRIYTSNLIDSPETILRRNLFGILSKLYPGASLSHRSALEFKPTTTGDIFISYQYTKNVKLPGLKLRLMKGHPPIEGDQILVGKLFASQMERALLENLQTTRQQGSLSKNMSREDLETRLENILSVYGEDRLNRIRDKAKAISVTLDMESEFIKLNKIIGSLLSTHSSNILKSPVARARAFGLPYDPLRLTIFEKLFIALKNKTFKESINKNESSVSVRNFAFFESYFSNYIEGTEFLLEEAMQIIDSGNPMQTRNLDSHDILGTFQLVNNHHEMMKIPLSVDQLNERLQIRHEILMHYRVDKNPGSFKDKNNRAGDTLFVDFKLVRGTLEKGYDYYQALEDAFARACYMMFLVSEVHPFLDGNGRIARVMMNAELVHQGQCKIIIPTVYRDDYLIALRKLSRQQDAQTYINMMQRAQLFSTTLLGKEFNEMKSVLEESNAFKLSDESVLKIKGIDFV